MRVVLSFCIGLFAVISGGMMAFAQDSTAFEFVAQEPPVLRGVRSKPADQAAPPLASPMIFRIGRRAGSAGCGLECAEFIYAEGEIQRDTATALVILWNRLKRKDLAIFINSPGGSLEGGLDLGRTFRKLGLTVAVGRMKHLDCEAAPDQCSQADRYSGVSVFGDAVEKGSCNSACVYAFAGGAARYISQESTVGIHQFFVARDDDRRRRPKDSYNREDFSNLQRTVSDVAVYLVEMGVSPELLSMAANVDSSTIRRLNRVELAETRLASTENSNVKLPQRQLADPAPRRDFTQAKTVAEPQAFATIEPEKRWPMVMRDGQPWLILAMPSQSRRFGVISNEVAIGCPPDNGRFTALFREIVPERPRGEQDASVIIGARNYGDKLIPSRRIGAPLGAITRENALTAESNGVLVVEVTSSATAGYPMRLEFPVAGLKSGMESLERACKH